MKRISYFSTLAVLAILSSCSYSDLSTEADREVADIIITNSDETNPVVTSDNFYDVKGTVGLKKHLGDEIVIEPTVTCKDNPEGDFTYEWQIPLTAFSSGTQYNEPYMTIGREKNLKWKIESVNPNSSTPYLVRLKVTDNKSGQLAMAIFHLYVLEDIQQGICAAYSSDGKTSDIALFRDETVTTGFADNYPGVDRLTDLTMYSSNNGGKFDGIITGMAGTQWVTNGVGKKYLFGWSRDKLFAQLTENHVNRIFDWSDWFYLVPDVIDVDYLYTFGSYCCLMSDNSFYLISNPTTTYTVRKFGIPSTGSRADNRAKGLEAEFDFDPHMSFAPGLGYLTFFEKKSGSFMYYSCSSDFIYSQKKPQIKADIPTCSLTGYTDWEVVSSTVFLGNNDPVRFLMHKKGTDDVYGIMTMDRLAAPKSWIILDAAQLKANKLNEAVGVFMDNRDQCLHYWTSDNVLHSLYYTVTGVCQYKELKKFDSEITGMWMFMQRSRSLPGVGGLKSGNAVVIATSSSQTQGSIYTIPYANSTDADLDFDNVRKYDVPGRISAYFLED